MDFIPFFISGVRPVGFIGAKFGIEENCSLFSNHPDLLKRDTIPTAKLQILLQTKLVNNLKMYEILPLGMKFGESV